MNIIRLKKLLRNHFENGFSFYFMLIFVFVVGIILGAIIIKAIDPKVQISMLKLSNPYYYTIFSKGLNRYAIFKASIVFNILFIGLTYILGILNLGIFVPLLIIMKGGFLGFNVGYLIFNFGWKGFLVSFLGIYPQYLLYIPCIIVIGALSMTISFKYKLSSKKRVVKIKRLDFTDYTIFILSFTFITIIGSLYEGFLSPTFLNLVNVLLWHNILFN